MSYPSNNKENEFNNITPEELDSMSTAELLELLENLNDTMTEDNFNEELVTVCLDALDRKSPVPAYLPVEESWHSFESKVGLNKDAGETENAVVNRTGRKVKRVFRTGLIAAIIVFCLFSCMIIAQAAGVDVFGTIARWTDSVFGFGEVEIDEPIQEPANSEFESELEYIESWIPRVGSEFDVDEPLVQVDSEAGTIYYTITYASDDNIVVFDAIFRNGQSPNSLFEKDENEVTELIIDRTVFYIFENKGSTIVAWSINNIEFSIYSTLNVAQLEKILNKSYRGLINEKG